MPTRQQILDAISAIDKTNESARHDAWLAGFYRAAVTTSPGQRGDSYRRYDAGLPEADRAVDPQDLGNRAQRGNTSAVADPDVMPDVSNLDLRAVKSIALALGAYDQAVRPRLAAVVLDRLRELGADRLADKYEALWTDEILAAPSDEEAQRSGAAHEDTDEVAAKQKLRDQGAAMLSSPSRADERRAAMPATKRRSK